jgi:hypothetical protein
MAIRLPRETSGGPTLRYHGAVRLPKLLIGMICLPLLTPGRPALTSAGVDAVDRGSAKLRALIEAARRLPLEQTALPVKLPAGEELGMVSWLARDPKIGVTWIIQRGDKADPVVAFDK